jgi:hypothetical protein
MIRAIGLALALALASTAVYADDDDDIPAAEMETLKAVLADLGCEDGEGFKKESEASTRLTMPSARWARWTSRSTRTSRCSSSRATDHRQRGRRRESVGGGSVFFGPPFALRLVGIKTTTPLPSATFLR